MIRFYLLLITFSLCQLLPAQDHYPCGAVEMQKKLFTIDKKWQELQERSEQLLVKKKGGFVANRANELFTLPVVVHVIHNNGSENISDIQIDQALANLNEAFSHSGPYKSKGEGFNTEIQFCLARRTFDNNATTGVNRIVSGLTNLTMETEDQALKNLSRWDPTQYINIWVVNEISSQSQGSGVAGYAYLAGMHGKPLDGLVCEAKFFGKSPSDDVVLIHEMGHYLNLLHTFDGGCTNNFCDQEGDKVCDTPPDQALHSSCVFNSCGTDKNDSRAINPFTTDVNDMTQNYMDYSPFECQFAFTKGQAERMRLTIQNIRESLLQSQGCLSPCVSTISGDISAPQEAVTGQNVNLSFSGSGATTFVWSVDGTQISTSSAQDYVFTTPGTYTIALVAGNQDVNCVYKTKHTITVKCNLSADFNPTISEIKEGENITFTSTGTGGKDYVWKIDETQVGTGSSIDYTFPNPKDYLIQLQVSNEYCSQTKTGKVVVQSACGDSIWTKKYTSANNWNGSITSIGEDGSMVSTFSDNFKRMILYTNAKGEKIWSKTFEKSDYFRVEPVILKDGSILLSSTINEINFNRLFITKLNKAGDVLWTKILLNDINSNIFRLGSLKNGGFCIATVTQFYKFDKDGNIVWSYKLENRMFRAWTESINGNIMILLDKDTLTDVVVILDANGNEIIQNEILGKFNVNYLHNTGTKDGGFLLIGNFWETHGNVLLKFDNRAQLVWSKKLYDSNYANVTSNENGDILLMTFDFDGKIYLSVLNENGIITSKHVTVREYKFSEYLFLWSKQNKSWVSFEGIKGSADFDLIPISPNKKSDNCLLKSINYSQLADVNIELLIQNEDYLIPNSNIIFKDYNIQLSDYDIVESNDCRIPNPCPKNCNQDLAHKKMVMENNVNVFFLNQTSFDEVLINGVFNPNSQIGTFYGVVSKNNQNNWMKSIKGQSFNLIKIVKNEDFYYLIGSNMISNLIIQKIDLNGNIIWSKRFNQIEKAHLIHDCKIINNIIYFGLEVQSKVVGESKQIFAIDTNGKLLWLKKLNNTSLQCSTVGIDGIWLVSQVESTKLLICKLDFYGNIVLEKYYETNSTIKFMYDPCAKTDGGLLLKFGFSISEILLLSADKFADIIFTKKIIGDRHNTSNISENNGYIFYCHHQVIPSPTFSVLDKSGNVMYTKRINGVFNEPRVSNYNNGWVAACVFQNYEQLIYFFPESQDDCILQSTNPIQVIDYPITATSGSMLLEDFIPSPAIDISAIESEEMFVSFDALCTVNAPCIEICDNGIDDDDNGLIDCSDLSCPCNTCLNKADLVLSSIDSIRCIGNEYMATLTICNKGDKDFNGSVPVTFYKGNPWGKSVSALSTSLQFVGSLEKDSCAQVTYRFTKYRDGDIYAVINAGENLVTPYDENTFFDDVDCNVTNNTKSILFAPSIPTLDLGPDVEICRGQVVNLSAQDGFSSYNWQDFKPNKNYTAFTQGLYAVTVSDYCGNIQKDEILIKEKKLVPIQLGEDKLICQGTSLEINLNPPANGKFLWDDGIEGAYRKLNSSGSYTLGFYTPENCVVKDTIEVVVIPAPVLSIEDSISICEGSTYTVVLADIDMKYNWYDGDTSSTKVFNQAGIYSVSASNEACSVKDSIKIDIINKPQINLPDSLSFCTGDSIRLSVQPQQSASYFWNTGEQTPDIVVKNSGTYILEANIKNCTSSDTVLVQEFFRPEISLQPIITACQGDTIALNVNTNSDQTILWSNGNTTNSTLISESGTYTVQISNKSCIASDTSEVTFFEKPITNLPEQLYGCEGKILQLELSVKPMEEIIWYDGTKDTLKQFDKSGLYSLTIKNEHCATLDTIQVTFHELPESFDLGKDTTLCDDLQLHINVTKNENYLYEWNDGVSSASRNISETGLYSLKVENRYGCIETDSIQVIFVALPEFSLGMDTSICKGDSFNINLILPENSIITWNDQSKERNRTLFNPGLYTATLDYYGCQTLDDIEIYGNDCNPFEVHLPNVFRYNSAVNGLFKPVINGDTHSISDYIMTIFDRWGNLVFKSSDPEIGWDGTYLGQPSESGVYIYILNLVFKDHSEPIRLEKQGSITLLK